VPEEFDPANDGEDPDRTDTMPLLQPMAAGADVADDAVPLQQDSRSEGGLSRAAGLAAQLAALQTMIVAERRRAQSELEFAHARSDHAAQESAQAAAEEAARHDEVVRSLQDALGARDAAIAELRNFQREREVPTVVQGVAAVPAVPAVTGAQHANRAGELAAMRRELSLARARASAYFECLQTRAWRLDYYLSMFPAGEAPPDRQAAAQADAERPIAAAPPAAEPGGSAPQLAALEQDKAQLANALATATARLAEQSAEIARLQGDALRANQEMTVLLAHLREARHAAPSESAAVQHLTEELSGARGRLDAIDRENHDLKAAMERLHASMQAADGWGGDDSALREPRGQEDYGVEFERLGDDARQVFALGRRTRIGRATGCEMQLESSSVSRHHALVLIGSQGVIIEDLHSTNGVFVNDRKIDRQLLHDGDILTIGESKFRFTVKRAARPPR